jgi:anti-sigma factor RsiW
MSAPETDDRILLVHAYCDGELDPVNAKAIEQQIAADPRLSAERDRIMGLRATLQDRLPGHPMPAGLHAKVNRALPKPSSYIRRWNIAAAAVTAAILIGAVAWHVLGGNNENLLVRELVASHARAVITARLTDVESSDQHTIKPWFSTKTAQAPQVVDLASAGYPLLGGRLDVIEKIPVPTLVYRHREHVISLTELPASSVHARVGRYSTNGFHSIGWTEGDTAYWATSDVAAAELDRFVQAFQAAKRQ